MTGISPSRALLNVRLAHLKIVIHGCANCQSLLCLKSGPHPKSVAQRQQGHAGEYNAKSICGTRM